MQDSGLWKRGLFLLVLMGAIAGTVLFVLLRRGHEELSADKIRPEPLVTSLVVPSAGFPAGISWGALYELSDQLPSAPGWEIRYNATLALARRGDPEVRLDVVREMLDPRRQMRNFRTRLPDGRDGPDEAAAGRTVLNALKAFGEWHRHAEAVKAVGAKNPKLQMVYAAIDDLAAGPNRVLRLEAQNVKLTLAKD
jgi:hypothetical protein